MNKKKLLILKPAVLGLGYVGLPLLLNLINKFEVRGYDVNKKRISDLKKGKDTFKEFSNENLFKAKRFFTDDINDLKDQNLFIVAVPTPIHLNKNPNLNYIKSACESLSKILKQDDIIIFESTVYPGVTNDICIKIIERNSGLTEGINFFVGYSPERVNPGDKGHNLKNIDKILAYPHKFRKKELTELYSLVSKKIVFSDNIKESETAKVIENIQRDVNIGLINEIYLFCDKMNINFNNVLNQASSKWNFIKFKPGLVGGHCLPVDPYYFSFISKKNKFNTKITLAGRSINNSMQNFFYKKIKRKLIKNKKILICGLTYKANVADLRNSLNIEIYKKLRRGNTNIFGFDPLISQNLSKKLGIIKSEKMFNNFDIYVPLVKHNLIKKLLKKISKKKIILDIFN